MWNENTKKPIWSFLALTFLIAWVCEGVLILLEQTGIISDFLSGIGGFIFVIMFRGIGAGSAPAWAMFILLIKQGQIRGFKDFFLRIFKAEKKLKTVMITTLFFIAYFIVAMISGVYLGDTWYFALLALPWLFAGIIGGGMEEPGWRGFLQPALEEKLNFIVATLIVGVIWTIWHFPAFFIQSIGMSYLNIMSYTLSCITLSFIMATLYKFTKCVFSVILFHSWVNALGNVFLQEHLLSPPGIKVMIISAILIITSIVICVFLDKNNGKQCMVWYKH